MGYHEGKVKQDSVKRGRETGRGKGKSANWIRNFGIRIGSEGWGGRALHRKRLCPPAGLGKSRERRTRSRSRASVDCHCFAGSPLRGMSRSVVDQQPTQNWHGLGESDCLIKTKHCDGQRVMLTQCDFCPCTLRSH